MNRNNGDYYGSASFNFWVERFVDNATGGYFHCDGPIAETDEARYKYTTVTLKIKGNAHYRSGKFYGLPEDCYPDDSDCEVEHVLGPDDMDWSDLISAQEQELIRDKIRTECASDDSYYNEDELD